jgi:2,3-dihydroxyphenylpropionate 1,2-dioxygenase
MMSSVIGGAMLPHAPQFFTMPETEDRNTVARVKTAAAEIGTRLRALRPDLWIIFANDHVEQFFHAAAPPFTIHVGDEAKGEFAGRQFHWRVPGRLGSRSCAKCMPRVSIRPSPASPRSITRSASR